MQQSFGQTIAFIDAPGTLYNTFTTAKSMLTSATSTSASAGAAKIPAGFFRIGSIIRINFMAAVSWASGNTMTFDVRLGPTANIAVAQSGAIKVTTTGGTTEPLHGMILMTCRAIGNGTLANFMTTGVLSGRMIVPPGATAGGNYSAGSGQTMWSEATPAVGTGFDSTVDNILDLFLAMGTSSASNGFQIQQYVVESLNVAGV